jgi:hypothetical protein
MELGTWVYFAMEEKKRMSAFVLQMPTGPELLTTGNRQQTSNASVSWGSKKQSCVALSTSEAEYIALAGATQEAVWIRQLLTDLIRAKQLRG